MTADTYYLGLDIGTDSVGYAVTDERYRLQKRHGEPMWGTTTFEAANQSADRRMARTARRRLDRKQMRVTLIKELFAKEIVKVDSEFFNRLTKSALLAEDGGERYTLFDDEKFTDAEYHHDYPTIHHLIVELMHSTEPHDIRLVYLACSWLVRNRGHFLNDVDKTRISEILSFQKVYDELMGILEEFADPWQLKDASALGDILRAKGSIKEKKKQIFALLNGGKEFAADAEEYPYNRNDIVALLAGGSAKLSSLYFDESYDELPEPKIELGKKDEDFDAVCQELGEDAGLLRALKKIYDWAVLVDILKGYRSVSEAKVAIYEKHHDDLKALKKLVHTYVPKQYDSFFRKNAPDNYTAYVYNSPDKGIEKKAAKEVFYKRLKALLSEVAKCEGAKKDPLYLSIQKDVDEGTFLPKQVNTDNRVIPHQLYWDELRQILEKASQYLDFLNQTDDSGLTVVEKILSVFEYRIVVGNVYHERFSKRWFNVDSDYSIKTKTIFSKPVMVNGKTIWNGGSDIDLVRRTTAKNNVHYTRYSFTRKGAFFDLQPVKAAEGLVPLKKGLDTAKYGGYNRSTAAFFVLVSYDTGKKHDAMIMPVELLHSKQFLEDDAFAAKYAAETISVIKGKSVSNVTFPLGKRILKVNTMLSLDGFKVCITGKSRGGAAIIVMPMMPLCLSAEDERYIKRLESFVAKLQKNSNLIYNQKYDGFTKEENERMYRKLMEKLSNSIYSKRVNAPIETLRQGEALFKKLDEVKQAQCLLAVLKVFGRMTAGCDLSDIGGAKHTAATGGFSSSLSNWKKSYSDARIVDRSASGLYETVSDNLLELV